MNRNIDPYTAYILGQGSPPNYAYLLEGGPYSNHIPGLEYQYTNNDNSYDYTGGYKRTDPFLFEALGNASNFQGDSGGFFSGFTDPLVRESRKTRFSNAMKSKGISFNKKTGLTYKGANVGKFIGPAAAVYQGAKALSNYRDAENLDDDIAKLISEIRLSADQSPTLSYDLTTDQKNLLRQLESGIYDYGGSNANLSDYLKGAASGALMGAGGGLYGAGIGAIAGLANAYTSGMSGTREEALAELEALYQAIMLSSQEANAIRRQNALRSVPGYHSYYGR